MRHTMRAEYVEETRGEDREPDVKTWHMVRGDGDATTALCGRELSADARTLPEREWGHTDELECHTCGALYFREVPSSGSETG
ncbi:hypothetical protein [Streptomyces sp. NPDC049881]|uniref:hypothetical protein n=1 Tax=unclassified Streptomyces TaxID=2593676 RepID=UPI00341D789D